MKKNPDILFNYSSILFNQEDYEKSLSYAIEANNIINNYDTQLLLADCHKMLNDCDKSIQHYTIAASMCPNRFIPLYEIFNAYKENNNRIKKDSIANAILSKKIKVNSPIIDNIIDIVKKEKYLQDKE